MIHELDAVVLKKDVPEKGLKRGSEGTVLETGIPGRYLVEFDAPEREDLVIVEVPESSLAVLSPVAGAG
jgi:hypothetical protein